MISLFQSMTMSIGAQIWKAVDAGDTAKVAKLVKRASADDFRYEHEHDKRNLTALGLASYKGYTEMVKMLVQAGADVNYLDSVIGMTALMWAAYQSRLGVVRVLLESGADKSLQCKLTGMTPIMWAAYCGAHLEVVRVLLEWGADMNLQDKFGETALQRAAFKGNLEVVRVLLEWGADKNLNLQCKEGMTALMWAAHFGYLEVVRVLLEWGADKNLQDKDGKTAADRAKTEEIRTLINTHVFSGTLPASKYRTSTSVAEAVDRNNNTGGTLDSKPEALHTHADNAPSFAVPRRQGRENAAPSSPSAPKDKQTNPVVPTKAASPVIPTPAAPSATANPVAFVEQDCQALAVFLQTAPHLQQTLLTVAAHDRALQVLVSKEKECPSLFWFYPKKPELRRWLSDPAKCLFQDSLMMVVVCPVTLCVVPCGPEGVGWEVNKPKKWVKEWGPAILFSIYVLQAAVVAGRVVGIPVPPVPGASEVKEALGLKGMLGTAFQKGGNQANLSDSLNAFSEATRTALDLNPELQTLCEGLRAPRAAAADQALPAHLPMRLVGNAYKSIHTFLTTGENAKLGKLEDQLRGRMERVMAPDGDIEWVSVEGKSAWLQKHSAVVSSMPQRQAAPQPSVHGTDSIFASIFGWSSAPAVTRSWLAVRLMERGVVSGEVLARLDAVLVSDEGEGFTTEESFAKLPAKEFHHDYLRSLGISAKGTATHLLELHKELQVVYKLTSASPAPSAVNDETAALTAAEKAAILDNMQAMEVMKKELDKLRAATASTPTSNAAAQKASGGQGGRGGLIQQQAQCNIRNPRTNQPYTMDELAAEIQRLQQDVAAVDGKVVGVAAAADERIALLEQQHAEPQTQSGEAVGGKEGNMERGWFKPW